MKTLLQVSLFSFLFIATSCNLRNDYDWPRWDVEASVPIGTGSIIFEDFFENTPSDSTHLITKDTIIVDRTFRHEIVEGYFTLIVSNGIPFDANISINFYDKNGIPLESLESSNAAIASQVDIDGNVIEPSSSVLNFPFDEMSVLLDRTKEIVVSVTLDASPSEGFDESYNSYAMDIDIIANFKKLISRTILE